MARLFIPLIALFMLCGMNAQASIWPRANGSWSRLNNGGAVTGNIKVPVIFVNFSQAANGNASDDEFVISETNQQGWITSLNATSDFGGTQFFNDMSYGKLTVTFEKVGTYTASGRASNYSTSYSNLVSTAVSSLVSTNWTQYDSNNDGFVDMVLLIYAGHADGDYNSKNSQITGIYPQSGWLDINTGGNGTTISGINNLKFSRYLFVNDLANGSANRDGLSTALHELGHALFDLPDYYNKSTGNPSYGSNMGMWDTMDYGLYLSSTYKTPNPVPGLSSFSRMLNGWLSPIELTEPTTCTLPPLNDEAKCYMIKESETHYYLLENRYATSGSWDNGLASGLIVTEVNESSNDWILYHQSNDGKVKVLPANNVTFGSGNYTSNLSTQPFGTNNVTEISSSFGSIFSTKTVTNIMINADGSVSFDFMGGSTEDEDGNTYIGMAKKQKEEQTTVEKTIYKLSNTTISRGSDTEFLILSANGWWGLGNNASASVSGPGATGTYTQDVNVEGNMYTFKLTKEGYLYNVGLEKYFNASGTTFAYGDAGSTVWTLSGTGSNSNLSYSVTTGKKFTTYYLLSPSIEAGAFGRNTTSSNSISIFIPSGTKEENVTTYVDMEPITLSIATAEGYGTYYNANDAYKMPEGLKGCFIIDATADGGTLNPEVRYDSGDIVPAGTPLLITGSKGSYSATLYEEKVGSAEKARLYGDKEANQLEGGRTSEGMTQSSRSNVYYYKLTYDSETKSKLGFYWGANEGAPFKMTKETTAYLAVSKSSAAKGFSLSQNILQPTAIQSSIISEENDGNAIYTITGVRLGTTRILPAGIYIRGGKKVFINK